MRRSWFARSTGGVCRNHVGVHSQFAPVALHSVSMAADFCTALLLTTVAPRVNGVARATFGSLWATGHSAHRVLLHGHHGLLPAVVCCPLCSLPGWFTALLILARYGLLLRSSLPSYQSQRERERAYQLHKQRLADMKPRVDNSRPDTFGIMRNNPKREQLLAERLFEIQRVIRVAQGTGVGARGVTLLARGT